ncbi:MAG: cytidylate kinase family protein, partial [Isosphaeraceae bacterium]
MASPERSLPRDDQDPGGILAWPGQLARWLLGQPSDRARPLGPRLPVPRFQNVALSREAGAGAGAIARMVGTRLDWKVYDHEMLEAIAQRMEVPTDEVRVYD